MAQPLLKLPVEIISMILYEFLKLLEKRSDGFKPHWAYSVRDCSALVPVSQTCRRLHEVVQSLPAVAKSVLIEQGSNIDDSLEHFQNTDVALSVFISRSRDLPPALRDWYTAEAHRVQELHLAGLGHIAMDFWAPILSLPAPKLRFLSLTSPGGSWLPPRGAFLPLPAQASQLRYLTLRRVCFLPQNTMSSLTHLALFDVYVPRLDSNLAKVLARCYNLESLVLSNVREGVNNSSSQVPEVRLPRLRRITLHQMDRGRLDFFTKCFQRMPVQALQLLDYHAYDQELLGKYAPDAHTLRIALHSDPMSSENKSRVKSSYRLEDGVVAVTAVGPSGAFHATRPSKQTIYFSVQNMVQDVLSQKEPLGNIREVWIAGIHPTKPVLDMDEGDDALPPLPVPRFLQLADSEKHRFATSVRAEIVTLPALEKLILVFNHTLEPNLYILPNATHRSFISRKLKTLRLVLGHGLGPHARQGAKSRPRRMSTSMKRPTLALGKVCESLATGNHAYLDTLVLQLGSHIAVDDADLLEIAKYVPTVKIERIDELPELALPGFCRETGVHTNTWLGELW